MARQQFAGAISSLERARSVALEDRQYAVAVESAARKLYVENKLSADRKAVKRDADVLVPFSKGIPGDHFARPLLLNNIGTAYMAAGDRAEAMRYFQEAHASLRGGVVPDLELAFIDMNVAMLTPDPAVREDLARGVWQRRRRRRRPSRSRLRGQVAGGAGRGGVRRWRAARAHGAKRDLDPLPR